jgi:hypothetical protein
VGAQEALKPEAHRQGGHGAPVDPVVDLLSANPEGARDFRLPAVLGLTPVAKLAQEALSLRIGVNFLSKCEPGQEKRPFLPKWMRMGIKVDANNP